MTAFDVLILLVQIGGFVGGAILGGRLSDKLSQTNRWYPLSLAGIIMAALLGYVFIGNGAIPNEWVRAALFAAVAFAGGLVVRARNRIS